MPSFAKQQEAHRRQVTLDVITPATGLTAIKTGALKDISKDVASFLKTQRVRRTVSESVTWRKYHPLTPIERDKFLKKAGQYRNIKPPKGY
ncbi:MAG: hypothetical protein LBF72_00540 [Holosporales bacterium]|jgi:hypothetical protein|nr:hypothetical protein [Holosporales bacterium]